MTHRIDDIANLCFWDDETRSFSGTQPPLNSVVTAGTYAYSKLSFPIIRTYAIGDGPVQLLQHLDFDDEYGLTWEQMPDDLKRHYDRAREGLAWFAAWNAGFDRASWNAAIPIGNPPLKPEMVLDIMAQAVASNLPPALEGASKAIGRGGKQDDGKRLINLFCSPDGATPQSHPEEWERFCSYAVRDTDELRAVWHATRKLPWSEWQEYWASEDINERGFDIDLDFARKCDAIAGLNAARSNKKLARLTGGVVTAVTQRERIATWVYDRLEHAEAREMMVKEYDEDSEDELKAAKIGVSRDRIENLLTFFAALEDKQGLTDVEIDLCEILEIRQWDGSSSPGKFAKMLDQHDGGKLKGSYVFNGAAQTGRFSSKGVQVHNLPNKFIGLETGDREAEARAIEMINALEVN